MWVGRIQSLEGLKSKDRFPKEEAILPQDCSIETLYKFSVCRFQTQDCNTSFLPEFSGCWSALKISNLPAAHPHPSHISQFLKINIFPYIYISYWLYFCRELWKMHSPDLNWFIVLVETNMIIFWYFLRTFHPFFPVPTARSSLLAQTDPPVSLSFLHTAFRVKFLEQRFSNHPTEHRCSTYWGNISLMPKWIIAVIS